jgi:hypothetical protein
MAVLPNRIIVGVVEVVAEIKGIAVINRLTRLREGRESSPKYLSISTGLTLNSIKTQLSHPNPHHLQ